MNKDLILLQDALSMKLKIVKQNVGQDFHIQVYISDHLLNLITQTKLKTKSRMYNKQSHNPAT